LYSVVRGPEADNATHLIQCLSFSNEMPLIRVDKVYCIAAQGSRTFLEKNFPYPQAKFLSEALLVLLSESLRFKILCKARV